MAEPAAPLDTPRKRQPPVAPPRVRTPMSAEQLRRLSLQPPESPIGGEEKSESDYRSALFNRLQQYYLVYESERVHQGIGHIVDWALANGEDALNERLEAKYGVTLVQFEEEQSKRRAAEDPRKLKPAESFMLPAPKSHLSTSSAGSSGSTMRDRLLAFYAKYDPDRARKGIDELVEYVQRKGLGQLNRKLVAKYGVTLEDFENGVEGTMPVPQPKPARLSMRTILRRSFRAAHREAPPGKLPPHVRPLLELYYSKYDQTKITSGGVSAIYRWAEKNGLEALNAQLKAKYMESLDEFADRMARLREDLVRFYTMQDPSKLEGAGIDKILRWGVRNGRAAINKQLRSKYGTDLEGATVGEEPEF